MSACPMSIAQIHIHRYGFAASCVLVMEVTKRIH